VFKLSSKPLTICGLQRRAEAERAISLIRSTKGKARICCGAAENRRTNGPTAAASTVPGPHFQTGIGKKSG
jgi:hypothetical protein